MSQSLATLRKNVAITVDDARRDGFVCLDPIERQFGMDFVVIGGSLKAIADHMEMPISVIKRMFNDPIVRAFIADLQAEVLQHRLINEQWVENQVMEVWPKLMGEETVPLIDKNGGNYLARKFHSAEVVSILKAFGGNKDQKAAGGVHISINFDAMGVSPPPNVTIIEHGED
jgi:hypothetical protein